MRSKDETLTKFREFQCRIENKTGNKIQILCTDRGGEYMSEEFSKLCKESGIKRELTQAHTPQQNDVSERRNKTIVERARSMLSDCHLPTYLWSEAVSHAQYLINRSPTRANHGTTPEAKYTGKTPNISNLKIFGRVAYVHVPKERRRKLDSKTIQCLFMGFNNETKASRLYDQTRRKIVISRDAVFDETKVGLHHLNTGEPTENTIFPFRSNGTDTESQLVESSKLTGFDEIEPETSGCGNRPSDIGANSYLDDLSGNELGPTPTIQIPRPANEQTGPPVRRYPTRLRTPSVRLRDF